MNTLETYLQEEARTLCPDYPGIEKADAQECAYAMSASLSGTSNANQRLLEALKTLAALNGIDTLGLANLLEEIREGKTPSILPQGNIPGLQTEIVSPETKVDEEGNTLQLVEIIQHNPTALHPVGIRKEWRKKENPTSKKIIPTLAEVEKALAFARKETNGALDGCDIYETVVILVSQRDNARHYADSFREKLKELGHAYV